MLRQAGVTVGVAGCWGAGRIAVASPMRNNRERGNLKAQEASIPESPWGIDGVMNPGNSFVYSLVAAMQTPMHAGGAPAGSWSVIVSMYRLDTVPTVKLYD